MTSLKVPFIVALEIFSLFFQYNVLSWESYDICITQVIYGKLGEGGIKMSRVGFKATSENFMFPKNKRN